MPHGLEESLDDLGKKAVRWQGPGPCVTCQGWRTLVMIADSSRPRQNEVDVKVKEASVTVVGTVLISEDEVLMVAARAIQLLRWMWLALRPELGGMYKVAHIVRSALKKCF